MKAKKLKVQYMHPREGRSVVGRHAHARQRLAPRPQHAHAYADAWSSVQSASWLENNYGYGAANLKARPTSSDLLRVLKLTDPNAVREPNAHIDRYVPRRASTPSSGKR